MFKLLDIIIRVLKVVNKWRAIRQPVIYNKQIEFGGDMTHIVEKYRKYLKEQDLEQQRASKRQQYMRVLLAKIQEDTFLQHIQLIQLYPIHRQMGLLQRAITFLSENRQKMHRSSWREHISQANFVRIVSEEICARRLCRKNGRFSVMVLQQLSKYEDMFGQFSDQAENLLTLFQQGYVDQGIQIFCQLMVLDIDCHLTKTLIRFTIQNQVAQHIGGSNNMCYCVKFLFILTDKLFQFKLEPNYEAVRVIHSHIKRRYCSEVFESDVEQAIEMLILGNEGVFEQSEQNLYFLRKLIRKGQNNPVKEFDRVLEKQQWILNRMFSSIIGAQNTETIELLGRTISGFVERTNDKRCLEDIFSRIRDPKLVAAIGNSQFIRSEFEQLFQKITHKISTLYQLQH